MEPKFYDNFNSSNLENDVEYVTDDEEELNYFQNKSDFKQSYKTQYHDTLLIINSKDRNYEASETTYNFSINFSGMSNSLSKNATINKNFKNITQIDLLELIIPDIYVNQKEVVCLYDEGLISSSTSTGSDSTHIVCEKISDLPYIVLNMSELENNNYGTNKEINKSSFILKYDDYKDRTNNSGSYVNNGTNVYEIGNINNSVLANSDRKTLVYKPFGELPIKYNSQPRNYLKNIKIDITTPNGTVLNNLSDYLTVSAVELKATSADYNKLQVTFSTHLTPDEYMVGNIVTFFDISVTGSFERCENFLNRTRGHTIIGHADNIGSTKLYKSIIIPLDFTLDLSTTTRSAVTDTFGLSNDTSVTTTGTMINSALQCMMAMKIKTEIRDEHMLHSNII
jgi:hypothetical protein